MNPRSSMSFSLSTKRLTAMLEHLAEAERPHLASSLPPFSGVLYGGAHLYKSTLHEKAGRIALATLETYGRDARTFGRVLGVTDGAIAEALWEKLRARLAARPVDAICVDFEDGYGLRSDAEEDADALRVASELAAHVLGAAKAPAAYPRVGVRIRALSPATSRRATRTLDLLLTTMLEETGGVVPRGFTVTLPKVTHPAQAATLSEMLTMIEEARAIARGAIGTELLVESPRALWADDGRVALPAIVSAAAGRCVAVHLGAYDLTASLGVPMSEQSLDHPYCDLARTLMITSLAGRGVDVVDGVTTALPVPKHKEGGLPLDDAQREENTAAVHEGFRVHARNVTHALRMGIHAGWDVHPAQLPARFGALYAHYLTHRVEIAGRVSRFLEAATKAVRTGQAFDDAASAEGAFTFFARGLACGALDDADVTAAGLTRDELATRSFAAILAARSPLSRP